LSFYAVKKADKFENYKFIVNEFYIHVMIKFLLLNLFLLLSIDLFAQIGKDTIVYNLPMVNDRLIYADSIIVSNHKSVVLDSAAKKWFKRYFRYSQADTSSKEKNAGDIVANLGVLEYHVKPGLINIPYYALITIHIACKDNSYSYKIYNVYFRPQSKFFSAVGFERDPEDLIALYKQKHIGFVRYMTINRGMIRNYLLNMNAAIRECIASLNKAMTD
jgi:hypothetical protein